MSEHPPLPKRKVPAGAAIVESIGWEDGRFRAVLIFPDGPPDLTASIVWRQIPVRLVECDEEAR